MGHLPRMIRIGLTGILIPLALFNGRPVAGCLCADGHLELICSRDAGNRFCRTNTMVTGSCHCCSHTKSEGDQKSRACCSGDGTCHDASSAQESSRGKSCQRLSLEPMVVLTTAELPTFDIASIGDATIEHFFTQAGVPCMGYWACHELGPPQPYFIAFQRLLI